MALKFIQDIKTEINTLLPDNSVGLITPALMRTVLQDMTDSLYTRAAALQGNHEAVPVPQLLTAIPTNYPALYNQLFNLNPSQFDADLVAGTITLLVAGFAIDWRLEMVGEGANGTEFVGQLYKNGIAESRIQMATVATGAGELHSVEASGFTVGVVAGDVFELRLSGTGTITFTDISVSSFLVPTFSAT
jgi:hypothetical protein